MMNQICVLLTATPQFVKDTVSFGNALMSVLLVMSGIGAVIVGTIFIIRWYGAEDNDKPAAAKRVKTVVFGAVGAIIFESVLKWVLSFYTH